MNHLLSQISPSSNLATIWHAPSGSFPKFPSASAPTPLTPPQNRYNTRCLPSCDGMCNRIKVHFCHCDHHGYMSVKACNQTAITGKKCTTGSEHIRWLSSGFEFRVAAVCWHKNRCRLDPRAAMLLAPAVPSPPPIPLGRTDQLRALDFLFLECPVLYVPYCQQQVIDGQIAHLPPWDLLYIAKPSLEANWFADEKISVMDMPHIETAEQSRDLVAWLGTARVKAESGDSD